jgi:hypothetical protein
LGFVRYRVRGWVGGVTLPIASLDILLVIVRSESRRGDIHCAIKKHHDAAHEKQAAWFGMLTTLWFGCVWDEGVGRRTYLLSRRRLRSLLRFVSYYVL